MKSGFSKFKSCRGFTLVELAIVITIIGLLIGGVLKGQELLENARMTSTASQLKGYTSAVITFKDIYKALPGDILNPGTFLQNCTTSPCNIAGNANGMIGNQNGWANENHTFWLHLAKAKLIAGINEDSTWTTPTFFELNAPMPSYPIGGRIGLVYLDTGWDARAVQATHYWHSFGVNYNTADLKTTTLSKFDLKVDDGRPLTGDILLHAASGTNATYDINNTGLVQFVGVTGF